MTSTQRSRVVNFLEKCPLSLKRSDVKEFEEKIYEMCKALCEQFADGISAIYSKFAFEKIGHLIKFPEKREDIIHDMDNKILEWNSVVFAELRDREEKDAEDQVKGMKMAKGEFKCKNPRCKSDECFYYQEQTRSSDEGFCTRVVCPKCGHRYSFN